MKKTCVHCFSEKPLDEFYGNPISRDKHHSWCKDCHKRLAKIRYHENARSEFGRKLVIKKLSPVASGGGVA